MGRPLKSRRLDLWMNGEFVGHWTVTTQGQHVLSYAKEWLESPSSRPVSLSMPLRSPDVPYKGEIVESFFDNLLPNSQEIRSRARDRFGAATTSAFDLLSEIGRDCAGAIQLLPEGTSPEDVYKIQADPLDDQEVADVLRRAVSAPTLGQREDDEFRISIAGAQEKTALLFHEGQWCQPHGSTPTTHIFKLPLGIIGNLQVDMSNSIENEWLALKIMEAYGLEAAKAEIDLFEDQRVLIVERFDRKLSSDKNWWLRLPQEDMCQALGYPPGKRYESEGGPGIREIMSLLLGSVSAQDDRKNFFQSLIIFWLLAAIDGHAKNFSVFIEMGGRYKLTPFYDVLSAYPVLGNGSNQLPPKKITMAMATYGKNRHYKWTEILNRHWQYTAKDCDFGAQISSLIEDTISKTDDVIERIHRILPKDFPDLLSDTILEGLQTSARKLANDHSYV